MKAQNRGTTLPPPDLVSGANSDSLMLALQAEQDQFELDNPHLGSPEDLAQFAAWVKKLKAKKKAENSPSSPAASEPSPVQ